MDENEGIVVNQSFTLTLKQVAEISEMKDKFGMNASAIVRMAIDDLYDENGDKDTNNE